MLFCIKLRELRTGVEEAWKRVKKRAFLKGPALFGFCVIVQLVKARLYASDVELKNLSFTLANSMAERLRWDEALRFLASLQLLKIPLLHN